MVKFQTYLDNFLFRGILLQFENVGRNLIVIGGLHPIVSAGDGQVIQKGLLGVYLHDLLCILDIAGKEDF